MHNKILNMTNKEAAEVIKNMMSTMHIGRSSGKTMINAALNTALIKAITVLENTPDKEETNEIQMQAPR